MSEELSFDDFIFDSGKLRLAKRGYVAVVIMTKTPNSLELVKNLNAINVEHLQTAYIDISKGKNRDVIIKARNTNTPITQIPTLAFFADQKFKSRYKDAVDKSTMSNYFRKKILEVAQESSSSLHKNENIHSSNVSNFTMSGGRGGPVAKGKNIPSAKDAGIIAYNTPWRAEKD